MNWLPGWGSIENTEWWSSFYFWLGIACMVGTLFSSVLNYAYSSHKDGLIATAQAKEVNNLNMQLEETSRQILADHSPKNKIKNLFNSIDPNILREIDNGRVELVVRMQPGDIASLEKLLVEPGGENMIAILGRNQKMLNSSISNGSLGPQGPVPEQQPIMLRVLPSFNAISQ